MFEIGCASGGNVIPIATACHTSEFLGIDLSGNKIRAGQVLIDQLGLKNIRLEVQDCSRPGLEAEKCDYIIFYGVFSGVPPFVQDKSLELGQRALNSNGVAYFSYKIRPGWNM